MASHPIVCTVAHTGLGALLDGLHGCQIQLISSYELLRDGFWTIVAATGRQQHQVMLEQG